jgi:hypothetical protein
MIALLRWLRVGVLVFVGLALLSPLIALNFQALRGQRLGEAGEVAAEFFEAANAERMRDLLPPDGQVEAALAFRNRLLVDQNLRADLEAPHAAGTRVHVGFVLADRGALPFPTDKQRQDASAGLRATIAQRDGKRGEVILERFEQQWKVTGVRFPADAAGQGPVHSFTRQPSAPAGPFSSPDATQPGFRASDDYDLLAPLSREQFEKDWKTDLDVKDEPAGAVADRLMKQTNLDKLTQALGQEEWRDRRCTLRLTQRSRLEALSRVAEQAGMELRVVPGAGAAAVGFLAPGRLPQAYAGPVRLVVAGQKENAAQATGVLTLSADYPGLPPVVRLLMRRTGLTVSDLQARTKGGDDLLFAERLRAAPPPSVGEVQARFLVPLRGLTFDVRRIASLSGQVGLRLPVKVQEEARVAGKPDAFTLGDVKLTLKKGDAAANASASPDVALSWTLSGAGPANRFLGVVAVDASGKALAGWWMIPPHSMPIQVPAAARSLKFRVATLELVRYEFRFEDVPLNDRVPDRLAKLEHPGHQVPLSAKAARSAGRVSVELDNHSNKSVMEVRLRLRGFDQKGRQTADRAITIRDAVSRQFGEILVVNQLLNAQVAGPRQKVTRPVDFECPDQTERFEADVLGVTFTDGSAWTPPAR